MKGINRFFWVVGLIVFIAAVWLYLAPPAGDEYNRMSLSGVLIQGLLSILTFATVCWSIWGLYLRNLWWGPQVELATSFDDVHCVLVGNTRDESSPEAPSPRLRIYAHATNSSEAPGRDCQVLSNQIFVSVDGVDYYPYCNILPATYKWVYAVSRDAFITDVRRSVDKYFRVLEIVQRDSGSDGSDEDDAKSSNCARAPKADVSWFEVCIPRAEGCKAKLVFETRYKYIMIPLTLVVRNKPDMVRYLCVSWRGGSVLDYKKPGMIDIQMIDESNAMSLIKK